MSAIMRRLLFSAEAPAPLAEEFEPRMTPAPEAKDCNAYFVVSTVSTCQTRTEFQTFGCDDGRRGRLIRIQIHNEDEKKRMN